MRLVFIIILLLFVFGCENNPRQIHEVAWFDIPGFSQELVRTMGVKALAVNKTFVLNNKSETNQYEIADTVFWRKELSQLSEIDLNSPQIRDDINLTTGIKDDNSNLLINKYSVDDRMNSYFKNLSVYYLDQPSEIRQISLVLKSDHFIAHSATRINLWLNRYGKDILIDSIQVIGSDKTFMQPAREYKITTRVER
jgi:hypothetical protein